MTGIYRYIDILYDGPATSSLILTGGFAPSETAESLLAERRQVAGGLCVTAILLLVDLLSRTILSSKMILGGG